MQTNASKNPQTTVKSCKIENEMLQKMLNKYDLHTPTNMYICMCVGKYLAGVQAK